MTGLRVALVQLAVRDGEPQRNFDRAVALIDASGPADVYVLPELWTTGYAHETWRPAAETDTPARCRALQELARARGASIAGSMISLDGDGRLANRLWLFGADGGAPATYDKGHLFAPMGEHLHLAPGRDRTRASLADWTVGLSLCFDLRFPEMYRNDALDGVELFVVSAAWPAERAAALHTLARARAIENQAFLALCNRAGAGRDGMAFGGGSMLVAPDGALVVECGAGESVAIGTVDRGVVATTREALPVLAQRRAGLDY